MLFALFLTGCNIDQTSGVGELGRLTYSLGTGYFVEGNDLTQETIVTNHEQYFVMGLTSKGESDAGKEARKIQHSISPSDGATLEILEGDEESEVPPDFLLTVANPGDYTLSATLQGDEFDRIHFHFDAPTTLELVTWARAPFGEDFEAVQSGAHLEEGAQVAYLGIPLDADGERLVGDIHTDFSADPSTAAVPAQNIYDVNETDTISGEDVPSLYIIEPGPINLTVFDTGNPASATTSFSVEAISE